MSTLEELKQIAKNLCDSISLLQREVAATADEPKVIARGDRLYLSADNNNYKYLSSKSPLAKHLAQ